MPVRISWSQHEVALLIDAYLRVAEGADLRQTAKQLSLTLREIALRSGQSIDETYRNVNGMVMQLANVQYLFTDGKKGLSGASAMIRQMYELYKVDFPAYYSILKEAIQMTGNTTTSVERAFFAYAKGKIGLPPKVLADYLQKAEEYCRLKQPLLGITDVKTVREIQQKVAEGNLLRFRYGKDAQTIRNVTQLYYNFVRSYKEARVQTISQTEATSSVSIKNQALSTSNDVTGESMTHISIEAVSESGVNNLLCDDRVTKTEVFSEKDGKIRLNDFRNFLLEKQQLAERTVNGYISALRSVEEYILQNNIGVHILGSDTMETQQTIELLMSRPDFKKLNLDRHYQYLAAMRQYAMYLKGTTKDKIDTSKEDHGLVEKAEDIVLFADLSGITLEALAAKLNVAVHPTKRIVQQSINIVDINNLLIHNDSFVDWEDGADKLEAILDKLMTKNNGYVSDAQLYEYARAEIQMFLNDNNMNDQRKVFDMAEHLFEKEGYHGKRYSFWMKTHISLAREAVTSKLDIMRKFARDEGGCFREDALEHYLQGLGIKTVSLRQQMRVYDEPIFLFYEPGIFITSESMGINDAWLGKIKIALQKLFDDAGDHVVLRDIQPEWYSMLPELPGGRPWTALLLQYVLCHYSIALGARTIRAMSSQNAETLHAMLVSQNSPVQTFADAVVSILVERQIYQQRFEAEELRQLLIQRGMIAGNELIWNMPKALPADERFVWDADGQYVTINL